MEHNELCKSEGYRDKVFQKLPQIETLDGKDPENNSVYTEDDESDFGEEGELDLEDEYNGIVMKLDPETRERFENGEMDE